MESGLNKTTYGTGDGKILHDLLDTILPYIVYTWRLGIKSYAGLLSSAVGFLGPDSLMALCLNPVG